MKLSRLFLLLALILTSVSFATAQDQSRRRASVSIKDKDPVSGYLIKSDADSLVIEGFDGKLQTLSLDEVTLIFIAPKVSRSAPALSVQEPATQVVAPSPSETAQPEYPDTPSPSPATSPSTGGPVRVRGYYRKDGTYVRPHTRRAPRRRG